MSDDDVLEATNAPPTVTDGVFGSEVFSGSASSIPASWSILDDILVFSNGVDQHQIYPGTATPVWKFVVFKGAAAPAAIPALGEDYTEQVTDGLASTVAVLDALGDLAVDYDCIFIMTPMPVDVLTWTVSAANATASVAAIKYKKNDNTWAAVAGFTDNTIVSDCTLGQSGTMTFTLPTDSMPSYMYGANGYWYQIYPGNATPVWKFMVFKGAAAPAAIPALGEDYTEQVTDGLASTVAVLDILGDLAVDFDCIFIMTPMPVDTFTWTVSAANATASVAAIKYKKNDHTWAAVSGFTDNTIVSACTLGQSGTMTFTLPTDSMPSYMYGANGY
ncbi:MAG: hypothetical protein Q8M94_08195, partial [Ignavibacteria bacterium]|nr:hypothetical protein [Ignavibacteria bacterium]